MHLGIYDDNELVACSSWIPEAWPADTSLSAIQLKGMAVAKSKQGSGIGAALLHAGIHHAEENGAHYIWARARDTALKFYCQNGFTVYGDAFIDAATGMSHHLVMKPSTRLP